MDNTTSITNTTNDMQEFLREHLVKPPQTLEMNILRLNELQPESKQFIGVYCITHRDSGRRYIGQSKDVWNRYAQHCRFKKADKDNLLQAALRKYGLQAFDFELLVDCEKTGLNKLIMEREFIRKYNTTDIRYGFNIRCKYPDINEI
jgi:hypothetical protein